MFNIIIFDEIGKHFRYLCYNKNELSKSTLIIYSNKYIK